MAWVPISSSLTDTSDYFPYSLPHTMFVTDPTQIAVPAATVWTPVAGV